jgi:hypothetical protein
MDSVKSRYSRLLGRIEKTHAIEKSGEEAIEKPEEDSNENAQEQNELLE